jgi:hypothetical protein
MNIRLWMLSVRGTTPNNTRTKQAELENVPCVKTDMEILVVAG